MSGSGCCGRIEGDLLDSTRDCGFAQRRTVMESLGPLYRTLKARYGDTVDVSVIDPRNQIVLLPAVFRDARRYGRTPWEALRTAFRVSTRAVVVNGRLFSRGDWPDPERLCQHLDALLPGGAIRVTG